MIVRSMPQGALHVTQADHARFAADLLRLFRLPELVDHPRRELLLRAVAEHDNGWWEADSAPHLAGAGDSALDFRAMPASVRQEIWLRGVERFAGESPYLAALVATHALRLSQRLSDQPSWGDFRADLAERRDELLEAAGRSPEEVAGDDRWLELGDALSLAICTGETGLLDLPPWRVELTAPGDGAGEIDTFGAALAPFPFAGATVFELSCRRLPAARFPSASALAIALATAPWMRARVRFTPL